jgi:hypothetical protein
MSQSETNTRTKNIITTNNTAVRVNVLHWKIEVTRYMNVKFKCMCSFT